MQTRLSLGSQGNARWLMVAIALAGVGAVGCGDFYGLTERDAGAGAGGEGDAGEPAAAAGARHSAGGAGGQAEDGQGPGGQGGSVGGEEAAAGAGGADPVDTSPVPILFDGVVGTGLIEALAPELGIDGLLDVEGWGDVSSASLELISDTEACASATLNGTNDSLWIMLPFLKSQGEIQYYDVGAHGITGFSFDLTSEPAGAAVTFDVSASYLDGFTFFRGLPEPAPSHADLYFADLVAYGSDITLEDQHYHEGVHRLIWELKGTGVETAYRFCVSNLRALRD